jgi:hypothetical protein
MKINYFLLLKVVILELLYSFLMFFSLFIYLFSYFGSGVSEKGLPALLEGKITTYTIIILPLLFNLYKLIKSYKRSFSDSLTYLVAEIIMILFFGYLLYIDFL